MMLYKEIKISEPQLLENLIINYFSENVQEIVTSMEVKKLLELVFIQVKVVFVDQLFMMDLYHFSEELLLLVSNLVLLIIEKDLNYGN